MGKSKIYLLFGSNIGDKKKHIDNAQNFVKNEIGEIVAESSLYLTEAWGFDSDSMFLNKIIVVESNLNAFEILEITQKIELKLGRANKTTDKYQSRIIDIDILFYDDEIIEASKLTIPHPQIQNRRFTLQPLAEIAPDFIHPKLRKSISQLLADCKDEKKSSRLQ
ncbi:MAG: 2-amino-4-hydroxy-6-hydroxymethyldihydropteridine diphosphokinase [Prevotellaceae bacterium]|jgi:2-amino-4-hydroxy-6-hydroxymethyldihydropteridine diphosphokinase|nr:2-amino-4-hydroxy-6-hydroxymethyldihydropteridine diphosphokinase [Prevotellaceae bacterium]